MRKNKNRYGQHRRIFSHVCVWKGQKCIWEQLQSKWQQNCKIARMGEKESFFHISIFVRKLDKLFGSSLEKKGWTDYNLISTKWKWIEAQKCQRKDLIPTTFWHQTSHSPPLPAANHFKSLRIKLQGIQCHLFRNFAVSFIVGPFDPWWGPRRC